MAVREQQRPDAEHRARVRREEAVARLHALADAFASDNEVELGDENELEVELTW